MIATETSSAQPTTPLLDDEDRGRAELYRLLAFLFEAPPTQELLDLLAEPRAGDSELETALNALSAVARALPSEQIAREYADLFVGAPVSRVMPYGSHYTNGQLFGRSLAELRMDLARLGIARSDDAVEPEDHIAILFEIMSGLIAGHFGDGPLPLDRQADFFNRHVRPWATKFFAEIEAEAGSQFYMVVAGLGRRFIDVESEAFRLV
jgi:TorA maturation chaperone TorD